MGKSGNTAKLQEKISCKLGIFPRQCRVTAGTDFPQVNKKVQMIKHYRINEQENFKIKTPLDTKRFHQICFGEFLVPHHWNINFSPKRKISTLNQGILTQKKMLPVCHPKHCVKSLRFHQIPIRWSVKEDHIITWLRYSFKDLAQSPWSITSKKKTP